MGHRFKEALNLRYQSCPCMTPRVSASLNFVSCVAHMSHPHSGSADSSSLSPEVVQMVPCDQALWMKNFLEKEAIPSPEECSGCWPYEEANGTNSPNLVCTLACAILGFLICKVGRKTLLCLHGS